MANPTHGHPDGSTADTLPMPAVPAEEPPFPEMESALPVLGRSSQHDIPASALWPIDVDTHGATDPGLVRPKNEDHFVIADLDRHLVVSDSSVSAGEQASHAHREATLLAVADGMGGHAGGALASQVVLDALAGYLLHHLPWTGELDGDGINAAAQELRRALEFCEWRLNEVADRKGLLERHPGTTLTAAFVSWPDLLLLHVGDSRLYLHRGGQLAQLTSDHTMVRDPDTDQKRAEGSPFRHVLTNAIMGGTDTDKAVGEVRWLRLEAGDQILLCSDGLTEHVTDAALAEVFGGAWSSREICDELIERANAGGGSDNITAVVARFIQAAAAP